ncbi:MAG TPA: nodulation protein NfeD [Thermodesulfobacteriota bacterium]
MKKKIFILACFFAFLLLAFDSRSDSDKKIILIEIDGTINPATLDYIRTGIEHAEKNSAEALVILLDTPGGLLTSTKEIVKLILNSPVPIVIYVSPSGATATSAGVFITLSAHIAAMAEGTSIGAAHPLMISSGGSEQNDNDKEDSERKKLNEKVENFASSFIESIAQKRKRNAKWAIEAVRNSASVTETEALNKNVIDFVSPDLTELIKKINGRQVEIPSGKKVLNTKGAIVERLEMNAKQRLIDTLSIPDIAFLLISLGSLGLLIEFYNPGLIFPGVVGAICLLLGLVSLQILPFNYAGLALLFLSIILFVSEIYLTSYGLLSIGGITSFVLGALLLFDTPESDVKVGFSTVIGAAAAIGLFFLYVGYYLLKAQRSRVSGGFEGLLGEIGVASTNIEKDGKIFIQGEYWNAESDEIIDKGDKIKVIEVKGNFRLKVKKV